MIDRKNIYVDYISDVALEISISHIWRKRIFNLKKDEILQISSKDEDIIPEYIKDVIVNNHLIFCVKIIDSCEEAFDEGLVIFKFYSEEFPEIISYSGNNPNII